MAELIPSFKSPKVDRFPVLLTAKKKNKTLCNVFVFFMLFNEIGPS